MFHLSKFETEPDLKNDLAVNIFVQDLSHFDPPTPPPDEDPHRYAALAGRKNRGKRVAHNPSAVIKKLANETKPKEAKVHSRSRTSKFGHFF